MSVSKQQYAAPEPLLSSGTKNFLESFDAGRLGLRAGRAVRRFMRRFRDPIQQRIWMGQFAFPVRNALLGHRPLTILFGDIAVQLLPEASTARDSWTGLRCEFHEVSLILSVLRPGMLFFDVGANAGLFTVSAAKKIGGARVFAFEPCSSTCDLLKRNLKLNQTTDVHVAQIALSDSVGEGVLQVNAAGKDGLNTLGRASHPDSEVVRQEPVRLTTVDAFVKEFGLPRVDVMKVDIEGAELLLLQGAKELLKRADAPIILYEGFGFLSRGFGYHPVEILWLLESCGYCLFTLNSDTGAISELKTDYQYDQMVIAAKSIHPSFGSLQARVK